MNTLPTETIFGIPYVKANPDAATAEWMQRAVHCTAPVLIAHSDVHVLTRMLREKDYGAGLAQFDYICPDGMPIVWLMRRKGADAHRLYGPDVMEWMWDKGREFGLRHFLFGGTEEACSALSERLTARFPGVQIAGHLCPPMGDWPVDIEEQLARAVRSSGAHCVWVGLGCPKQERWLYTHRDQLPPALYFGVGAAFNFHAGLVRQAPAWVRAHGLEWAYRLCREPRRLFRRYLVHNSLFLWYCLTKRI